MICLAVDGECLKHGFPPSCLKHMSLVDRKLLFMCIFISSTLFSKSVFANIQIRLWTRSFHFFKSLCHVWHTENVLEVDSLQPSVVSLFFCV